MELTNEIPQYRKGDHPIFTFNAFALQGFNYPPFANIPDKIIMGEGILAAFTATVKQFMQVFFNIGDCSFTSDGHHGTPTQRMAAAAFGYSVANNAQKQGHILTAQQFTTLFEAQLPKIVLQ
ncbi:hypothetical protein [Dyadobacter sp. CY326]|uniref:hypothetical protein n=1 Tax=Dyadobacter sp. CY326 TaxID=2907300 RepID=UPI001F1630EE|nr:hypothetical protein [Dyadobacter sp. CY326]MCE7065274.1 hypothetical protein [Dyadobacter sp. CY326]